MAEFMGKDGFVWWQGVVEDRHDPLFLGRCRIRILGWHTEDKTDMPTESLPWSYPVQPIISAAQTGVGISPTGPVEGTWVVGFYRDGEQAQEPVFFGTLGGIPELPSVPNVGFNDPRGDTVQFHPDLMKGPFAKSDAQENPLEFRPDALEDNIPYPPKNLSLSKEKPDFDTSAPDGTSEKNTKRFLTQTSGIPTTSSIFLAIEEYGTRSTYPRNDSGHVLGQPTTPRAAIGKSLPSFDYSQGIVAQKIAQWGVYTGTGGFPTASLQTSAPVAGTPFTWKDPIPQSIYGAKYPYNHVHQSESGHLIEVDDTPGKERLHRYHRTGTFEEIGALGQKIVKVVNENFHIGLNNDYTAIFGNKYENISGKLDIVATNGLDFSGTGNINMKGKSFSFDGGAVASIKADGTGITLNAGTGVIELIGRRVKKTITEAADTDTIRGSLKQKIGGLYSLETGSTSISSRGSTGIISGGALDFIVTGSITETIVNASIPPSTTARQTTALFGDVNFNPALGSFNVDCGPMFPGQPGGTSLFASLSMSPTGNISMKSLVALATFDMSASGIELKALGGLASISIGASGIELSYAASSIKLGPAGITLEGVLINSKASGINTVEGSLVKLN
jgi:hypothetical protein